MSTRGTPQNYIWFKDQKCQNTKVGRQFLRLRQVLFKCKSVYKSVQSHSRELLYLQLFAFLVFTEKKEGSTNKEKNTIPLGLFYLI